MRLLPAILLSFLYFHWLFTLSARETSSENRSKNGSIRARTFFNKDVILRTSWKARFLFWNVYLEQLCKLKKPSVLMKTIPHMNLQWSHYMNYYKYGLPEQNSHLPPNWWAWILRFALSFFSQGTDPESFLAGNWQVLSVLFHCIKLSLIQVWNPCQLKQEKHF